MAERTPQRGECDYCGGAHWTGKCVTDPIVEILKKHKPVADHYECECCGGWDEWTCEAQDCGWNGHSNYQYTDHIIALITGGTDDT